MKCKGAEVYLEPRCYLPPFDEAVRIDERIYLLVEFLNKDDIEMARKELKAIREILDKVEVKIEYYASEEFKAKVRSYTE